MHIEDRQLKPGDTWLCICGKESKFSVDVTEGWDSTWVYHCECGRTYSITAGTLRLEYITPPSMKNPLDEYLNTKIKG